MDSKLLNYVEQFRIPFAKATASRSAFYVITGISAEKLLRDKPLTTLRGLLGESKMRLVSRLLTDERLRTSLLLSIFAGVEEGD